MTVTTSAFVVEVYDVERLKSHILMKRNIKALLRHRGKGQGELARHLRRKGQRDSVADSWISHILDENSDRELPMEHWDRAAEFLGVDTYHFFLPGVANNELTERRQGSDRRKSNDRRLGQDLPARPRDLDLMNLIRALSPNGVEEGIEEMLKILDRELRRRRSKPVSADGPPSTVESAAAVHAPKRDQKRTKHS